MQLGTVAKSAIASGLTTVGVIGATAAMAGSGVGGVFNLGQSNSVNGTSTLTGATTGPQLQVTNSSSAAQAAGIGVTTASGRPPFTVNRNVRVPNLNADMVDGYHASWFSRAAQGEGFSPLAQPAATARATATVVVPQPGFVAVSGSVLATDYPASTLCNFCYVSMRLGDDTGALSQAAASRIGGGGVFDERQLAMTYIFPATTGTHVYSLFADDNSGSGSGGPAGFLGPVVTAQYLPF